MAIFKCYVSSPEGILTMPVMYSAAEAHLRYSTVVLTTQGVILQVNADAQQLFGHRTFTCFLHWDCHYSLLVASRIFDAVASHIGKNLGPWSVILSSMDI